jgi:hypothetical protein
MIGSVPKAMSAARVRPVGVAVWSQPARRTRIVSGTDSCSSGVPAAHSPPMPKPARKRKTANAATVGASPQQAVKTE